MIHEKTRSFVSLRVIRGSFFLFFDLAVGIAEVHHRDTERTEEAQSRHYLCVISVSPAPLW
jgi:hypothetical protein